MILEKIEYQTGLNISSWCSYLGKYPILVDQLQWNIDNILKPKLKLVMKIVHKI